VTEPALDHSGENLLRELAPQVLGAVIRRFRDFSAAEDAVQEALLAASQQWPRDGVPANPRGWLIQVAARRMTDYLRAELARRRREYLVVMEAPPHEQAAPAPDQIDDLHDDDALVLLFMCCHPSLTPSSAIALTLRAVGGLTTAEIANAFLVPEATMAQRISRAKQKVKSSGVGFQMPTPAERTERLSAVLHVLYLIFNEGYASSVGPTLQRRDLASEAIRLTRAVHALLPDESEVTGLLALMLLTDARRAARTGPEGELVPLGEQDRHLWDRSQIAEGFVLVTRALRTGLKGAYQLQAAIAALHDEAEDADETDWPQILGLYELLGRRSENPMVALNHTVAVAMVHGAEEGLRRLEEVARDERIAGHYRVHAVRAHLLEMAGDNDRAASEYLAAAARTTSLPEQEYLRLKAARIR
jgi:RNA polymerase sigma factor (sigma-70 family)